MKNNIGFVQFLERAYSRGDRYILGGFGNVLTSSFIEAKCRQYAYNANNKALLMQYIGRVAHDCYGLLKAYIWGNEDGQGIYVASQDRNETMAKNAATDKGALVTIPRKLGACVWKDGHVGFVVDCSQADYRDWIVIENYSIPQAMLRRPLRDGGWTDWYLDTFIDYSEDTATHTIVPGDTLWAIARKYGLTLIKLQSMNPGVNANDLRVGQIIRIKLTDNVAELTAEIARLNVELADSKASNARISEAFNSLAETAVKRQDKLDAIKAIIG